MQTHSFGSGVAPMSKHFKNAATLIISSQPFAAQFLGALGGLSRRPSSGGYSGPNANA
jgi:hypothetical protein